LVRGVHKIGGQIRVREPALQLSETLTHLENIASHKHKANDVLGRSSDRDHGPAVGVAGEDYRSFDLLNNGADRRGVRSETAVVYRWYQHGVAAVQEFAGYGRPGRGIRERAMHEHDGRCG
jgi:hypothetical protein